MTGGNTTRWEWARRGIALLIAAAALGWLFHRVDAAACWSALRNARPGWIAASVVVYGLGMLPAARRWHLMLHLGQQPIPFSAALRLTFIGHLLYYLLFGAVGGDAAKSALAARWYRLPLPEVLSAAPLDRLAAFGGLVVLALLATGVGALEGAFSDATTRRMAWTVVGAVVTLLLLLGSLICARRIQPRGESAGSRWWRTTRSSFELLFRRPGIGLSALMAGLLQQVSLSAVLALNLAAVTEQFVPWLQVAWCLPVIWLLSGLPVTVAGLGFREGAAVALLALYGVAPAQAAAASLLVVPVSLVWAAVGAGWWAISRRSQ